MRILRVVLLSAAVGMVANAQEETLIRGDLEHGGFGGPVVKLTRLNGENAVLVGGRGGWIIGHTIAIGGGGYALVTNVKAKTVGPNGQTQIELGYGGLELEYVGASDKMIHTSFLLLIGGGSVSYKQGDSTFSSYDRVSRGFFVLEPSAQVYVNVTTFFRIAAGISYRYVAAFSGPQSSSSDLGGLSGTLTLAFGKF